MIIVLHMTDGTINYVNWFVSKNSESHMFTVSNDIARAEVIDDDTYPDIAEWYDREWLRKGIHDSDRIAFDINDVHAISFRQEKVVRL